MYLIFSFFNHIDLKLLLTLVLVVILMKSVIGQNVLLEHNEHRDIKDFLENIRGSDVQKTINGAYNSVYYTIGLPKDFDASVKWPNCPSIGHIYNQGNCRSSFAVSVASAVSDRICIHSNGTKNPIMSSQHIMSCCYLCGPGCKGRVSLESWDFYRRHGFVSGGDYNSGQGCQPYTIKPCQLSNENPKHTCTLYNQEKTPTCEIKCSNPNYPISYRNDIYKGIHYSVNPYMAMKKIYENGPITTQFYMYTDLNDYKSGVYQYDEESDVDYFGSHSIKVFGWGEENGVPYWLAANSFGPEWGNSGTFKIARGTDGCFFEEQMHAGLSL